MAANEILVKRVREVLADVKNVEEKKMFGGSAFMVNDKMCINVSGDNLMLRFNPDDTEQVLEKPGVQPMVMKGRNYAGYCYVSSEVITTRKELNAWCRLALDYNPLAKASAKKSTPKKTGTKKTGTKKVAPKNTLKKQS